MALRVEEAASRMNVSRGMVYREIKAGRLKAVRIGTRMIRVREEDLKEYLEKQTVKVEMMQVL